MSYNNYDDDDDNWLPFDYTSDTGNPSNQDDLPPPDSELPNKYAKVATVTVDIDSMPIVEATPPPVVKKQKTAVKKDDDDTGIVRQSAKLSKEDIELQTLLDRYDRVNATQDRKPTKKAPAASKAVNKKLKTYPTGSEEVEKHQSLLMQIDRYRLSTRFQDLLRGSGLKLSGLEDRSIEELEDVLTRVRTVIGNRSSAGGGILGNGILAATSFVENMPIGREYADIRGLSNMLGNDQEFQDIVEQLSIDYSIVGFLSPEKRLLIMIAKSGFQMNAINQFKAGMASQSARPNPSNLSEPPIVGATPVPPSVIEDGVRYY